MCLHLLSDHCWTGLTISPVYTTESSFCGLLLSFKCHDNTLNTVSVAVIYAKINYSLIPRGLVSQFLSLVFPHALNYCVL